MDRQRLEQIVHAIGDRLEGDWLLLGGAVVALWIEPRRSTEDVDVIGFKGTFAERSALMDLAVQLGLPIEAINSAADYFVHRIPDWREQAAPLYRGAKSVVWRPSATLFVLLKIGRLSSQDLADCLALLEKARAEALTLDAERLLSAVDSLPSSQDVALRERRARLREALASARV
jgi:hypothetical protein